MAASTLLLLRHGIAEERRSGLEDGQRALTERGRSRTRAVLDQLMARGLQADRLLCSPLLRARQTAEIAVMAGWAPAMSVASELAPAGDAFGALPLWLAEATAAGGPVRLALVGHEPDLSALAARLIGASPGSLALRKAGLIQLELPDGAAPQGRAVLAALLRPGLLLA
ncbi:MAG: phosphohistidine phosphatase SixA [Cyanobium sp.]